MNRPLISFVAAAIILGSSVFAAAGPSAVSAAPPPDRPTIDELFEARWNLKDPFFIQFPNLVTPITPDGAWICLVPVPCLRSDSVDRIEELNQYLEELEEQEKEGKNNPPPSGGGGGGAGGGISFGGGFFLIGGTSGGGEEERYGEVGPIENLAK